jgi:hypothetical protein
MLAAGVVVTIAVYTGAGELVFFKFDSLLWWRSQGEKSTLFINGHI